MHRIIAKPSSGAEPGALASVFVAAAAWSYTWSMLVFLWEVPSLLLRFRAAEIIGYGAYQLSFSLAESLMVTLFIGLLGLMLPRKILRQDLRGTGAALAFAFAANSLLFKGQLAIANWLVRIFAIEINLAVRATGMIWIASLIILPVGMVLFGRSPTGIRVMHRIVDHLSVLVAIYVFLSILALFIVIIRNLQ